MITYVAVASGSLVEVPKPAAGSVLKGRSIRFSGPPPPRVAKVSRAVFFYLCVCAHPPCSSVCVFRWFGEIVGYYYVS